ncbi:MAG: GNAT family protein [Pseudomonadota bacterium]
MAHPPRPTLEDGDLRLRAPQAGDVDARMRLGNTPAIIRMFGGDPNQVEPITKAHAQHWVQQHDALKTAWMIEHEDRLIGSLRLHSFSEQDRRALYAIGILDARRLGQGLGTRATRLIVAHAFDALGLHRLGLRVLDFNKRAIAAYRKVGFVVEGRARQSAFIAGEWFDDVMMGLLAPEWRSGQ